LYDHPLQPTLRPKSHQGEYCVTDLEEFCMLKTIERGLSGTARHNQQILLSVYDCMRTKVIGWDIRRARKQK
jgi:hypothetical protein